MLISVAAAKTERKQQFSVTATRLTVERLDMLASEKRWSRSNLIEDILEKFVTGRLTEKP
jgi:metal-responsive CopG/Arc/MetJ family transcriptional regulator